MGIKLDLRKCPGRHWPLSRAHGRKEIIPETVTGGDASAAPDHPKRKVALGDFAQGRV
jgi:hypothetical protein